MSGETTPQEHLKPEEVAGRLEELGALLSGHFRLSSGRHSNRYFQCARVLQYPDLARELGRLLAETVDELEVDLVLSPAVGGILLGHEVARGLGRRHVFCERRDGAMQIRRGFEILKGENALLVDDVLTRGTSAREMTDLMRRCEAQPLSLAVIVDRRDDDAELDLPVVSLIRSDVSTYEAGDCFLCREGLDLTVPGSRHDA